MLTVDDQDAAREQAIAVDARARELVELHGLDDQQADAVAWLEVAHTAVLERSAEAERARRTVMALEEDVPVTVLADVCGVSRPTIYRWESQYGD